MMTSAAPWSVLRVCSTPRCPSHLQLRWAGEHMRTPCSACAGATAGYFLRNRQLQGARQQLGRLALVVGLNFLLGSSQGSMIDNSGHLGGLAVGCPHATSAVDLSNDNAGASSCCLESSRMCSSQAQVAVQ